MNQQECMAVLTKIQIVDNRNVDKLVLAEWLHAIGHLDYRDAIESVAHHRRTSTDYLTPAHVVAGVRTVRNQRAIADRQQRAAIASPKQSIAPPPWVRAWIESGYDPAMKPK